MQTVLLDTNIISFILKNDTRASLYKPYLNGNILAISFMTVAELYQWAAIRNWGDKRIKGMENALKNFLVLPFDIEMCRIWGNVRAKCRSLGQPISPQDAWIASAALQYKIPLITHNPDDFSFTKEIKVISAK